MFITFEGVDGSGKSTQARQLYETLKEHDINVVLTREPGGAPGAEEIRRLLVEGDPDRWSPETELLLFNAARRDHLERTIRPALEQGMVVLCDRFADSTRAFQVAGNPELIDAVEILHRTMIGIEPDLTLILDIDPIKTRNRGLKTDESRFEEKGLLFQETVRDAYLDLAEGHPSRCFVFDADRAIDEIADEIEAFVVEQLSDSY